MATNTTNIGLIKPAGTDKVRIAQINQNMDIIDEKIGAVGNTSLQAQITAINPKRSAINSLASDNYILGLQDGVYQVALNAASDYLPERYGTLVINRSGSTYGVATFASTTGETYFRHMNGVSAWHNNEWIRVALNSQIDSLNSKITPQIVDTLPYANGMYYLTTALTVDGVTITAYSMYNLKYRHTAQGGDITGTVLNVSTGDSWSLTGTRGAFVKCQKHSQITVIRYNATLEANQYIFAPFTHYAEITLDTSKGTPVSARINGQSTKAKVAMFTSGGGKCFIQGIGSEEITVDITYVKNPLTA